MTPTVSLIVLSIVIDSTVVTGHKLFTRVMRVNPLGLNAYLLSSKTGIKNHGICAIHCKAEVCHSFSYTEVAKRCDTYSRVIGEEKHTDVSRSAMYFSKNINNCSEVKQGSPSCVFWKRSATGEIISLFCDTEIEEGPWTVIQRRTNGNVDFYRNWTEYKNGFGDLYEEFWLGNDIIHLLTKTLSILRVELEAWDGTKGYAQFSMFQLASEEELYKLTARGFSGNVSYDALAINNAEFFTTYDSDNDKDPDANKAQKLNGAWWYRKSTRVNLNGRYQKDNGDEAASMSWNDFPSGRTNAPLRKSTMMIQ